MEKEIQIADDKATIAGKLRIPGNPKGVVLFSHGSGSGRFSPRNNFVADILHQGGFATLLIDLLSQSEDELYQNRFNIKLLTKRLMLAITWLKQEHETQKLPLGLFGASTGAASALQAASIMGQDIKAVVSRGGRPDLAMAVLDKVSSPTLLIVGENDFGVIDLNRQAFEKLKHIKKLAIVPRATHLFEESGCLEEAASLAKDWFEKYLK
jgi:putative phosphoribosyl transferase